MNAVRTPRSVCWSITKYVKFPKEHVLSELVEYGYPLCKNTHMKASYALTKTLNLVIC